MALEPRAQSLSPENYCFMVMGKHCSSKNRDMGLLIKIVYLSHSLYISKISESSGKFEYGEICY